MTTERDRLALALACGLGLGLSACGGAAVKSVNAELEAEIPAPLRADYTSFTQNCAKCHGLERALNAHVNDVHHWDLYVAKMMRTAGSAINAREAPRILRFLYWYTEREKTRGDAPDKAAKHTLPPLAPEPVQGEPPATTPSPSATSNSVSPATVSPESIEGDTAP